MPSPDPPAEATSFGYALVRSLVRFLLALFYGRIEVAFGDRIPRHGPLIVAANHHNSVVDAMLLLAVVPRPLRTLVNAPLFKHPLIGPFLRMIGAVGVHRRQEAGTDPARNAALFAATRATLQGGGAIMIFPEGRTQPEPVLLELRTGTARMLLDAESSDTHVTLVPVGLVFHDPGTFRDGRALVLVGEPIATDDCVALARSEPEQAARLLTDRLTLALRNQIVEADDRETLRLLGLVEELWAEETGAPPHDEVERVASLQRAMRTYHVLQARVPERIAKLRSQLAAFSAGLEAAGLDTGQLSRAYPASVVVRFAVREGISLLVGTPLAIVGIVIHVIPYQLTALLVRLFLRHAEEEATDKIAAGLLLYPLAWLGEGWAAYRLGGVWAIAAFVVLLIPAGFAAIAWRARLERVASETRAFARFFAPRGESQRLVDLRKALADELAALARLAPEAWPE